MRRRFLLIANSTAGPKRRRLLGATLAALVRQGALVTRASGATADAATKAIRDAIAGGETDAVIAAGGDGTFRQVATAAAGSGVPVGLVPMGTGNVLAQEISLSRDPDRLAKTLLHGRVADVQGGTVNGAPFFLWAGAGFDGRVVGALNQSLKRLIGRAAYLWPGLRAIGHGPDHLDIEIDGKAMRAGWVIVTNARCYGSVFTLSWKTSVIEPGLVAVVVPAQSRLGLVNAMTALAMGRLGAAESHGGAFQAPCMRVVIHSPDPVPVQVDGDQAGTTPVDIRAGGLKVRLIVPN